MANSKIRVEVALCPDEVLHGADPDMTWPRPAGLKVSFDEVGSAHPPDTTETNSKGLAVSRELTPGSYEVNLDRAEFAGWAAKGKLPFKVDVEKAKHRQLIVLTPPSDHRLVPLLLRSNGNEVDTVPISRAKVTMTALAPADWDDEFPAHEDGHVYALVPHKDAKGKKIRRVKVKLAGKRVDGRLFEPVYEEITVGIPEPAQELVEEPVFYYEAAEPQRKPFRGISVEPKIKDLSGKEVPLTGARVAVELQNPGAAPRVQTLEKDEKEVRFSNLESGVYLITVTPPPVFDGWPIKAKPKQIGPHYLHANDHLHEEVRPFQFEQINGIVVVPDDDPDDRPVDSDIDLVLFGPDGSAQVTAKSGKFAVMPPSDPPLQVNLASGSVPTTSGGIPLEMRTPDQEVKPPGQITKVELQYKNAIIGRAVDESGMPMSKALIVVYQGKEEVARTVARDNGDFTVGLKASGNYSIAIQTEGGRPVTQTPVSVRSRYRMEEDLKFRRWEPPGQVGSPRDGGLRDGSGPVPTTLEAVTDLAAYPVLTEGVTTTGPPAPGYGRTGAGAEYGQVVEQVVRDVLGWRPSTDVNGFQAALTGAFQLREVEGHTEWTWQQRGYAVQADMGALTGAQASIYARAKSALDQILPLLAGLTPLNPALYPPQDLETIRTVITTELQELVSELALEGGPRIQRVDELFGLLLGDRIGSRNLNPDVVQGQLGKLRDRFGLTVDQIETVEHDRIVTNFRIVVEHVLALQASWSTDRDLLTPLDPRASFGTILVWLSRSLEAVCESVGDLEFAMDSVFVDAAQRQVIDLNLPGEKALLLSDLLDWVRRATRDEGPRIIQDAGKDGVFAFAPVLRKLRDLVRKTRHAGRHDNSLPHGLRTPRVDRAFQVLVEQLEEAARLASHVRSDLPPQITSAEVDEVTGDPIGVLLTGTNFQRGARAFLIPQDREELPEVHSRGVRVTPPGFAVATFRNPRTIPGGATARWLIVMVNPDGAQSDEVEAVTPQMSDL
jgi:hypothetical protein